MVETQGASNRSHDSESTSRDDPDFRTTCLRRDNYQCVVTGNTDLDKWEEMGCPSEVRMADLQAAHIIPLSYASWRTESGGLPKGVGNAWEVLWRYFPRVKRSGMTVQGINEPFNAITLRDTIHVHFRKFRLAFVATDQKHVYRLKTYVFYPPDDKIYLPEDRMVKLQAAPDAENVSLPSPDLLDCHHRVAEILNASGMGRVIDQKINEWEDMRS